MVKSAFLEKTNQKKNLWEVSRCDEYEKYERSYEKRVLKQERESIHSSFSSLSFQSDTSLLVYRGMYIKSGSAA